MAQATLTVGGRRYDLACRDGAEPRFEALARIVDAKAQIAAKGLGGVNEARQLLLAALLLADELQETKQRTAPAADPAIAPAIAALADRIEALAARLEKEAASA